MTKLWPQILYSAVLVLGVVAVTPAADAAGRGHHHGYASFGFHSGHHSGYHRFRHFRHSRYHYYAPRSFYYGFGYRAPYYGGYYNRPYYRGYNRDSIVIESAPPPATQWTADDWTTGAQQSKADPTCLQTREFQTEIVIDGETVPAYGEACLKEDGSWELGGVSVR